MQVNMCFDQMLILFLFWLKEVAISQDCRRLEGTSGEYGVQPPAIAGSQQSVYEISNNS